jgi:BolA protein
LTIASDRTLPRITLHGDAVIVSVRFEGLGLVERHRAVYAALGDLSERRVHALALKTYTPEEWRREGP